MQGEVLLECGVFNYIYENGIIDSGVAVTEFTLEENERLIGMMSDRNYEKRARHASVRFIVGLNTDLNSN